MMSPACPEVRTRSVTSVSMRSLGVAPNSAISSTGRSDWSSEPTLSAGFAELQVGPDAPGFYFLDTGPGGVEAAGPEVGASLGWALPLGLGLEAVAELSFSVAHFAQAPRLVEPLDPFQPSVAVTAGIGW